MRFLHTADWQLGKSFGRFDEQTRAALGEARFDVIDTIGKLADRHGAAHVLVAGDVFDTEGPDERTVIQAVSRMARYACRWWLLPGNHDFARNRGLWDRVRKHETANIIVLSESEAQEMEPGAWLLPAPLLRRHTLDDPTAALDTMETPAGALRIGLGHGSIRDFSSQGDAANLIAPDRVKQARLDYLALGDWHGTLRVDARTWYAGTPEPDRFPREANDPGHCLLVECEAGAAPTVTVLDTARYTWQVADWPFADATGFEAQVNAFLESVDPAATLLQLTVSGIVSLTDKTRIVNRLHDDLTHRLRFLDTREGNLSVTPSEDDMASLESEGLIGRAAVRLREMIETGGSEAPIARRALEKLFIEANRQEATR
ncbi:metallophosphoesterase family protein [Novosphingobium profundi]|uniref:metallophosphoesterase family protein n=1 Tax=Novosphingobium profundi TaxID=1774954 RepID=UPI001CFEB6B7|nr:DNA repair exonuclease [Novosphingobium profundi]